MTLTATAVRAVAHPSSRPASAPSLRRVALTRLALTASVVTFAVTVRRTESRRWLGVALAAAMALYIPQLGTGQPIRVAPGLLVLLGCVCLALTVDAQHR